MDINWKMGQKETIKSFSCKLYWGLKFTDTDRKFNFYEVITNSRCNFTSQPVWINVLRDPVDRYISFFNFLRFHANTFVAQHSSEHQYNLVTLTLRFFHFNTTGTSAEYDI